MGGGSLVVGLALVTLVLVSPAGLATASVPHRELLWGPSSTHIQHIITVMLENRDYDNFFGVYCLQLGKYCSSVGNGIPAGTCVPYDPSHLRRGCVAPYNLTPAQLVVPDMAHDWWSGMHAWNGGAMNGFYKRENNG